MALSVMQIKRWTKMLMGRSVEHVHQNVGRVYEKSEIKGYYNDLTEKVTINLSLLDSGELPLIKQLDGQSIHFPVAIFQYALGCYDLWLLENKDIYKTKFLQCAEWILAKQDSRGRWDNFSHIYPDSPYGAMAQGEAISVLLRAYNLTGEEKFLEASKPAVDFMLLDLREGGTTEYKNDDLVFWEYTNQPVVMNGWIFAWWGLYDYVLATNDKGKYKEALNRSLETLVKYLPRFKNRFWSSYDLDKKLASPFYHNLHIAQMQVMYDLTRKEIFIKYAKRWRRQQHNPLCKSLAFIIKAIQKILE